MRSNATWKMFVCCGADVLRSLFLRVRTYYPHSMCIPPCLHVSLKSVFNLELFVGYLLSLLSCVICCGGSFHFFVVVFFCPHLLLLLHTLAFIRFYGQRLTRITVLIKANTLSIRECFREYVRDCV